MEKRQFQTESKRILDLMINSIYTNKDIFLRELISNSSDAIDKLYYISLRDSSISFNKDDFYIKIERDTKNRKLIIKDTGIGMSKEDLIQNLGTIAKSGSLKFKEKEDLSKEDIDIIGQFGVGFYSAFMISKKVTVLSRYYNSDQGYKWESNGVDGYTIEEYPRKEIGTTIVLDIKDNTEKVNYDQYLEENKLISIIKKYSDFIRYPIKMEITKVKTDEDGKTKEYRELDIVNSMVPLWRKNKNELELEDYENFYYERNYGYDKPLSYIHFSVDGMMSYKALVYIPTETPFDYYTTDFEKGLELYSRGVLIKEKCAELLPDYFSFVRGVVDSEDLSLNISREMLQNDRQLVLIKNKLETKIKEKLLYILSNNREEYKKFYASFGKQLKIGIYMDYGQNKDKLQDLLLFYSSDKKDMVTLKEYIDRMNEEQKYIYYLVGDDIKDIDKMPQTEYLKNKGYEILYFDDEIDEFAIKIMSEYQGVEFKSASDVELEADKQDIEENKLIEQEYKDLFEEMENILLDKVEKVTLSNRLIESPVCFSSQGDISLEMEKTLKDLPNAEGIKAKKILEINREHKIFEKLKNLYTNDLDKFKKLTNVLYNQACLIDGIDIDDPLEFANDLSELI